MKILVTGCKGQLGYDVSKELLRRGDEPVSVDVEEMDVTDREAVNNYITRAKVDAVIHCAAWTG